MTAIEDIRAAAHAGDRERIARRVNAFIAIAADRTHEAHHYLAQNATPAIRELLALRLMKLMVPVKDKWGRQTDYATWRVEIPTPREPWIIMALSLDVAHNLWVDVARRRVFALAWRWHANAADDLTPEDYERGIEEFVEVEFVLRVDEAAEGSRRLARLGSMDGVNATSHSDRFDGLHYHFAHAFLTLWLDGDLPARLYAPQYEVES
jgi:hypothetical protein